MPRAPGPGPRSGPRAGPREAAPRSRARERARARARRTPAAAGPSRRTPALPTRAWRRRIEARSSVRMKERALLRRRLRLLLQRDRDLAGLGVAHGHATGRGRVPALD